MYIRLENIEQSLVVKAFTTLCDTNGSREDKFITIAPVPVTANSNILWNNLIWNEILWWSWALEETSVPRMKRLKYDSADAALSYKFVIEWVDGSPFYLNAFWAELWLIEWMSASDYFSVENTI